MYVGSAPEPPEVRICFAVPGPTPAIALPLPSFTATVCAVAPEFTLPVAPSATVCPLYVTEELARSAFATVETESADTPLTFAATCNTPALALVAVGTCHANAVTEAEGAPRSEKSPAVSVGFVVFDARERMPALPEAGAEVSGPAEAVIPPVPA